MDKKGIITSDDCEKYRLLQEDLEILWSKDKCKILYAASDGKTFENELQRYIYDQSISRVIYYEQKLANRNWLQRLFNIKPDMRYYDEMSHKAFITYRHGI